MQHQVTTPQGYGISDVTTIDFDSILFTDGSGHGGPLIKVKSNVIELQYRTHEDPLKLITYFFDIQADMTALVSCHEEKVTI